MPSSAQKTSADTGRAADSDHDETETAETLIAYYREMALIRSFELRASEMYARARIGGYCHLNLGEEATVVGLMAALRERDYLFATYRDHGYALARGMEPGPVMAELFGKTTGVSSGRGGSMHLFDADRRMLGGYGIVGGQVPPAVGAALAISMDGPGGPDTEAVMCMIGDGATNIGSFHESLNLAAIWNLPIVFVIVNNRLGMGTPVDEASAEPELYKRGSAYRIDGVRVDGGDVVEVRDAALAALEQARVERRPALIEAMSYRLRGHSVVDPARYRSAEDTAEAKAEDPVPRFREQLIDAGHLDAETATAIDEEVEHVVNEAVKFAEDGPDPSRHELFDNAYATEVANAPRSMPGERLVVS